MKTASDYIVVHPADEGSGVFKVTTAEGLMRAALLDQTNKHNIVFFLPCPRYRRDPRPSADGPRRAGAGGRVRGVILMDARTLTLSLGVALRPERALEVADAIRKLIADSSEDTPT